MNLADLILLDWMLPGGSGDYGLLNISNVKPLTRDIPVWLCYFDRERWEEDRVRAGNQRTAITYEAFSPKGVGGALKPLCGASRRWRSKVIEMRGLSLDHGSHRVMTGDSPRWIWGRPNLSTPFLYDAPGTGFTAANSYSIMSGAPMCTLKTGRSTCIFAPFA